MDVSIFRNLTNDDKEKERFKQFASTVTTWVGHNFLGYDYPVLYDLISLRVDNIVPHSLDTLILSKLVDYSREGGHSIEAYGREFGLEKGKFSDWSKYSQEMEDYCVRDVEICHRIYNKYIRIISDDIWKPAILLEHHFQLVVNELHNAGFCFNSRQARELLQTVQSELQGLDEEILKQFPPKLKLIRAITPRRTKHGTLNKSDFRFVKDGDLSEYSGDPFSLCSWVPFNPSSHKQLIGVLSAAGWSPTDRTQTHVDTERELQRLRYSKNRDKSVDLQQTELYNRLLELRKSGWKINEQNLSTLPKSAPAPARTLARRILLEARRRTLTEWLSLVQPDGRIHGKFYGLGAWTHRMAHQQPNTANIPTDVKLYGKEMRSLWQAPSNRLLVGVDAEGIQLRIFAHYIDDKEFTDALVKGRKEDQSDPHSLNRRIIGAICKSRQDAKRFIYALLLGAGLGKLAQILGCSEAESRDALERILDRYTGFKYLKDTIIPKDAKTGWFQGLDGRSVKIPGDTTGERKHLCMSGYLQNGEAIIVKRTVNQTIEKLLADRTDAILVDVVHDEVIFEVPDKMVGKHVLKTFCDTIVEVGQQLGLKCPLAGDGHIGTNWSEIH